MDRLGRQFQISGGTGSTSMEQVKVALSARGQDELEVQAAVDGLDFRPPRRPGLDGSFFEAVALHGIRVDRIGAGFLTCSFTVPPRLTVTPPPPPSPKPSSVILSLFHSHHQYAPLLSLQMSNLEGKDGNMSPGAIANIVDEIGGAAIRTEGLDTKVSVDMSICILSTAKLNDELEITSQVLGHKEKYSGTIVVLRNKTTGELLAEGRHSLFGSLMSKV